MAQTNTKKIIMITFIGKFILTGVFIFAAYSKILDPATFIKNIHAYEILPAFLINPFGHSLPFIELVASLLIWIPQMAKAAMISMGLMLMAFIIAISYAILTDKNINCGCFGNDKEVGIGQLIIDLFLFLDITILYFLTLKKESNSSINGV